MPRIKHSTRSQGPWGRHPQAETIAPAAETLKRALHDDRHGPLPAMLLSLTVLAGVVRLEQNGKPRGVGRAT